MPTGKMYSNTKPEHFACEINHMIQSQCLGIKPDTDVRFRISNYIWIWYFAFFPNKLYSVHIYIISPGVKDILLDNGIRWCVYNTFFLHNNYRNSNIIDIPYIDNIFISLA